MSDLSESMDLSSLTEEQQDRVSTCVSAVEKALIQKDRGLAVVAVWNAIRSALRENDKARLETLRVEPTDLILVKMDTEHLSGGTELHQFAERLRELVPENAGIIMVQNEAQLQALDETQMARLGWRKVENSNLTQ